MDDLEKMMFGFGDERAVLPETAELMEEMLYHFLDQVISKSYNRALARGMHNKVLKSDLIHLFSQNPKYRSRIAHILIESKQISKITKAPEEPKVADLQKMVD